MIDPNRLYEMGMNWFGGIMGSGARIIKRPDYSNSATPETDIGSGTLAMRVDRGGGSSAQPSVPGADYYIVCPANRSLLKAGDVIIKSGSPTIVVQQIFNISDCIAIQMEEVGRITTSITTNIFTNVRFDYLSPPTVISGLDPDMQDSVDFGSQRLVIWGRPGVRKGMRLVDDANDKIWFIEQVIPTGDLLVIQATERPA